MSRDAKGHPMDGERLVETPRNRSQLERVDLALRELVEETLRRGFHGIATVGFTVQDGTIQDIRRSLERIER